MSLFYCVNYVCLCEAEGAYILYYIALVANTVAKRRPFTYKNTNKP